MKERVIGSVLKIDRKKVMRYNRKSGKLSAG